jgi:hypothetical protein
MHARVCVCVFCFQCSDFMNIPMCMYVCVCFTYVFHFIHTQAVLETRGSRLFHTDDASAATLSMYGAMWCSDTRDAVDVLNAQKPPVPFVWCVECVCVCSVVCGGVGELIRFTLTLFLRLFMWHILPFTQTHTQTHTPVQARFRLLRAAHTHRGQPGRQHSRSSFRKDQQTAH